MGRWPSITWAALITKGGRSGRSGLPVGPDPRVPCQGLDHQRVEVPTGQLPGSPAASGRRRERSRRRSAAIFMPRTEVATGQAAASSEDCRIERVSREWRASVELAKPAAGRLDLELSLIH